MKCFENPSPIKDGRLDEGILSVDMNGALEMCYRRGCREITLVPLKDNREGGDIFPIGFQVLKKIGPGSAIIFKAVGL